MSGTVGVIAQDQARYSMFWNALITLQSPVNTVLSLHLTSDRVIGRNAVVREALDKGSEWVLFLDDDQMFSPRLLMQLLSHDEMVVGALYLQRAQPFTPVAFTEKVSNGTYLPIRLSDHGPTDLVECAGLGTGGMLIRSEVFRAVGDPWFEHGVRESEDLVFSRKAREAGFKIYCDLAARMGHFTLSSMYPHYDTEDQVWMLGVNVSDHQGLTLPLFELTDEEIEMVRSDTMPADYERPVADNFSLKVPIQPPEEVVD